MRMIAAVLLAITLLVQPITAGESSSCKAENIIVVTLDGFRWQELFTGADEALVNLKDPKSGGARDLPDLRRRYWKDTPEDRREAIMPFFWGTIAKKGQVFGNPARKAAARITNGLKFSYPGYSEMFCGFADP